MSLELHVLFKSSVYKILYSNVLQVNIPIIMFFQMVGELSHFQTEVRTVNVEYYCLPSRK